MTSNSLQLTPEIIRALNDEIAYQSAMQESHRANSKDSGVVGQIVSLNVYARRAEEAWESAMGDAAALHELRTCAGIAIRALLKHGCPVRSETGVIGAEPLFR